MAKLPVELLTPLDKSAVAGIIAFRHPAAEAISRRLHAQRIHIMSNAGRLRVAIHGYNTQDDITHFLRELTAALKAL